MSKTKKEINIDITELQNEIKPFEVSVTKPIANGVLRDGRRYQVQVIITTEEDEFIDEK
jgi:hypothetical protein